MSIPPRFDPQCAPPQAPNPDYLPSDPIARAAVYSHYAFRLGEYYEQMRLYSNGFAYRVRRHEISRRSLSR